jgi:hypothetical protein
MKENPSERRAFIPLQQWPTYLNQQKEMVSIEAL